MERLQYHSEQYQLINLSIIVPETSYSTDCLGMLIDILEILQSPVNGIFVERAVIVRAYNGCEK